ncbi:MAG: hypothetical protein AAGU19_19795 [Prolixibacteraceae bacterium]
MKTSRIIFISFFSTVSISLLSLTIQTRNPSDDAYRELNHESYALPPFSHLVIKEGSNVRLDEGPADSLQVDYPREQKLEHPVYSVKGDTLIIEAPPHGQSFFTNLSCSKLKSLRITRAELNVSGLNGSMLKIDQVGSRIYIDSSSNLDTLTLNSIDSHYRADLNRMKSVQVSLEKSTAEFWGGTIEEMNAEIRDTSSLSVNKVLLSNVRSDESSSYKVQ